MNFLDILKNANWTLIFAVAFGVSEALSLIPAFKSNGIFQAVANVLKFLKEKIAPAKPLSIDNQ